MQACRDGCIYMCNLGCSCAVVYRAVGKVNNHVFTRLVLQCVRVVTAVSVLTNRARRERTLEADDPHHHRPPRACDASYQNACGGTPVVARSLALHAFDGLAVSSVVAALLLKRFLTLLTQDQTPPPLISSNISRSHPEC
jgi:hypothetical protein